MNSGKVIALIPARGGSKRLSNKNLLLLNGKPLISLTIEAALNCSKIDEVIVSTDSIDIKDVALKYGASVPFLRPKSLANDFATTDDVMMHAIEYLNLKSSDVLILLQPTSPLRGVGEIDEALNTLLENDAIQGVVTVCECEHSPLWSNILPDNRMMGDFIKQEITSKRSQDLPKYYRLNGAIYAYNVSYLKKHRTRHYSSEIKAVEMSVVKSVDIDNESDFKYAEFLHREININP